ncbi:MAG: hypothetical protein COB17_05395 [Sulfurimonas sp.]|nr:MAG: hypothetical protein COB17_05395 [Sulfurimonas sp.]
MTVSRYVFQSPYSNKFQIGRLDPSLKQEQLTQENVSGVAKGANTLQNVAKLFLDTQIKEVKATVDSIDIYA